MHGPRACPPVLEVDIPISPCGGDPCPESHSPHRQWLPSNNIARILIAFCFFSGLFYQKTYSLYGGNALFPCLWVIWDWRVMYTCFYTQNMDPMTAVLDYLPLYSVKYLNSYVWPFGLFVINNYDCICHFIYTICKLKQKIFDNLITTFKESIDCTIS